jgi:hypothetical protein
MVSPRRSMASAQDDEPLPALVVNPHRPNRYELLRNLVASSFPKPRESPFAACCSGIVINRL